MVISGAGVSRLGVEENALITSVDLHNTFLEVAGLNPSDELDSQSFYSLLNSETSGQRRYNYTEVLNDRTNRSGYTITNGKYKLIVLDNGSQEYYDLITDPGENNNLLDGSLTSEATVVFGELTEQLGIIRR
jgi:arylsulfatase A-like enzyme